MPPLPVVAVAAVLVVLAAVLLGVLLGQAGALAALPRYRKTVMGLLMPALPTLLPALADASPGGRGITWAEGLTIASAMGLTGAAVYQVANEPPAGKPADPQMSEQEPVADLG